MANKTLRIATVDRATYVDINSSAIYIRTGTWRTTPEPENGTITETFELAFTGNDATIRSALDTLSKMVQRVVDWNVDGIVEASVWWEENSAGESTTMKRSLITDISFAPSQEGPYTQLLGVNAAFYSVMVVHRDVFEDSDTMSEATNSSVSTLGGTASKGTVAGSADGRIAGMRITSGQSDHISKLWIGFRSLYGQTSDNIIANFSPLFEAESGSKNVGSWITVADSNTSPNGLANNAWEYTTIPTSLNAAADWYYSRPMTASNSVYARGKYIILGRMKVDAGTVGVEFCYGHDCESATPKSIFRNEMQYVSNTAWSLVELGSYRYPMYDRSISMETTFYDTGRFGLRVMQISGTTNSFRLDCILLIPSDRLIKATGCINFSSAYTGFWQTEDDNVVGMNINTSLMGNYYPTSDPEFTVTDWARPWDGGILYFAGERSGGHTLGDVLNVSIMFRNRYRAFIV